jgi:hypothetical protein
MPIKRYDRYYGGNAAKALKAMAKQYGPEKGRRVFYATANKRKKDKR